MIVLGTLLVLAALIGTPLFVILGGLAWWLFYVADIEPAAMMIELYRLAQAPTLLTIPLFTFAGYVLAASQAPQRLVHCTQALMGWLSGGLALVALLACTFFTAFTGASGVTIVALGGLLLPLLLREQYPEPFSLGLLTTCGSLGLLFPPSLPIILYGLVAHAPIELLFLAGIVPGLLLLVLLALLSVHQARRAHVPLHRSSCAEVRRALWEAKWELSIPQRLGDRCPAARYPLVARLTRYHHPKHDADWRYFCDSGHGVVREGRICYGEPQGSIALSLLRCWV